MRKAVWAPLCVVMNSMILVAIAFAESGRMLANVGLSLGGPLAAASAVWCGRQPRQRVASWVLWLIALLYALFWCMLIFAGRYDQPRPPTTSAPARPTLSASDLVERGATRADWTSKPGNSKPPATLSAYIGVNVSTSIAKQGSTIYGDIAALVVVQSIPPRPTAPIRGNPATARSQP